MKDYANFDLSIERSGERCRARVLRSPAGESQPEDFASPFSPSELEALFERAWGSRRDVEPPGAPPPESAFVAAGARLFEAVFTKSVRRCLDVSLEKTSKSDQGLRLRLRLGEPEFATWPWEYLCDSRRRWLALQFQVSIVRYPEMEEELQPLAVAPPLHVLVVEAAATGRRPLKAEPEWTGIERDLEEAVASGRVVLDRLPNSTLPALREKLRSGKEHHVLHFIGHGGLDSEGEGMLFFAGEQGGRQEVSGRTLGALLLNHPPMRLVVLNSCEGAREGREEAFSSVAEALVRSRVPAVVAMQVAVSDRAALSFARHFYRDLAEGPPLDEVLSRTREGMLAEHHEVEWGLRRSISDPSTGISSRSKRKSRIRSRRSRLD